MAAAAFLTGAGAAGAGGLLGLGTSAIQEQWNRGRSKTARNFNRWMSNTAYQRAVGDLYAAGLNPILAVQGMSGASSTAAPVAGSASGPTFDVARGVDSAKGLAMLKSQQRATEKAGDRDETAARVNDAQSVLLDEQRHKVLPAQVQREQAAAQQHLEQARLNSVNRALAETALPNARAQAKYDMTKAGQEAAMQRRELEQSQMLEIIRSISGAARSIIR